MKAAPEQAIEALRQLPIPALSKGFGSIAATAPVTTAQLVGRGRSLWTAGFEFPLLTLRESALAHNVARMAEYCAGLGVLLCPHGKTAMSPQLAARQLAAGAWGITVASLDQLRVFRSFGFHRLLIANEIVDPAGIHWLAEELQADESFEVYCFVDSPESVALLDRELTDHQRGGGELRRRLPVLVELGYPGGRTGARGVPAAVKIAQAVTATGTLRVAGVAGYEGSLDRVATGSGAIEAVTGFCRELALLATRLRENGLGTEEKLIVSAGGSGYFDIVAAELTRSAEFTVLLRSGAYASHDDGHYQEVTPAARGSAGAPLFQPALELWAPVLSRPEPTLAILGVGRRHASFDAGLPIPKRLRAIGAGASTHLGTGWIITALDDQHCYLQLPADAALSPGDLVGLGISHPCSTFDKWRAIPVVDDADHLLDVAHTFF